MTPASFPAHKICSLPVKTLRPARYNPRSIKKRGVTETTVIVARWESYSGQKAERIRG